MARPTCRAAANGVEGAFEALTIQATGLYGFRVFSLPMMNGQWTLWAKGRAVNNGFIGIHSKRPGSPQANCPQVHSPFCNARGGATNQRCRLASENELRWRGATGYLLSAEGQTGKELPHPHRQASMRNLAARNSHYATADLSASSRRCEPTSAISSVATGGTSCKPHP